MSKLGLPGKSGDFELMRMSDNLHGLIIKSASAPEIREVALTEGMSTLQSSGWAQVKRERAYQPGRGGEICRYFCRRNGHRDQRSRRF